MSRHGFINEIEIDIGCTQRYHILGTQQGTRQLVVSSVIPYCYKVRRQAKMHTYIHITLSLYILIYHKLMARSCPCETTLHCFSPSASFENFEFSTFHMFHSFNIQNPAHHDGGYKIQRVYEKKWNSPARGKERTNKWLRTLEIAIMAYHHNVLHGRMLPWLYQLKREGGVGTLHVCLCCFGREPLFPLCRYDIYIYII